MLVYLLKVTLRTCQVNLMLQNSSILLLIKKFTISGYMTLHVVVHEFSIFSSSHIIFFLLFTNNLCKYDLSVYVCICTLLSCTYKKENNNNVLTRSLKKILRYALLIFHVNFLTDGKFLFYYFLKGQMLLFVVVVFGLFKLSCVI